MDGLVSWLVLVAAFVVVAGACGVLAVRLFSLGAPRHVPPGKPGPAGPPPEPQS
jgi:hypothetical protein